MCSAIAMSKLLFLYVRFASRLWAVQELHTNPQNVTVSRGTKWIRCGRKLYYWHRIWKKCYWGRFFCFSIELFHRVIKYKTLRKMTDVEILCQWKRFQGFTTDKRKSNCILFIITFLPFSFSNFKSTLKKNWNFFRDIGDWDDKSIINSFSEEHYSGISFLSRW